MNSPITLQAFNEWIQKFMAAPPAPRPVLIAIPFAAGKRYRQFGEFGWMPLRKGVPAEKNDVKLKTSEADIANAFIWAHQWGYSE